MRKKQSSFSQLQMRWQRSWLGNSLGRVQRAGKTIGKRRSKPQMKSAVKRPLIVIPSFVTKPINMLIMRLDLSRFRPKFGGGRWFLVRLAGVGVLVLVGLIGLRIINLELVPSNLADTTATRTTVAGETLNILFVLYDQQGDYPFVDLVGIFSINKREQNGGVTFINIDPDFMTTAYANRPIKLRSVLANAKADGANNGVDALAQGIQTITAIRIDRYIIIDKQNLANFMVENNILFKSPAEIDDPDVGVIQAGMELKGQDIIKYLAADSEGNVARGNRMGQFIQYQFAYSLSWGSAVGYYTQMENLAKIWQTNLTKAELLDIGINLLAKTEINYVYLAGQLYGRFVASKQGGYYVVDTLILDSKLKDLLQRTRIAKEQARIEIYNGTTKAGLATSTKRLLSNQGANIIRAGNSPEQSERSKLYVANPENFPANIALISESLNGQVLILEEPYPYNHTGDMVLVIGGQ